MNSNAQLRREVERELIREPSVDDSQIRVIAQGGVVTLTGRVSTYAEKFMATDAARHVLRVAAVANELCVSPSKGEHYEAAAKHDLQGSDHHATLR